MQNIPRPSTDENTFTVYVRSGCPYCTNLIAVLNKTNTPAIIINCDAYMRQNKEKFFEHMEQMIGHTWKTVPIVFLNRQFIGGYTETIPLLQ